MMLRVTDLKQWVYCRRIVYFQHRLPGVGQQTYKMSEGKAAQEMVERLEMRRTLREYGMERAVRRFDVWLESEELGLAGKLDLLLETETSAAIVEFKLTSGDPQPNHRLQLAGYSLLVEQATSKTARCAFLYRIPDGQVFPISIDEQLHREARRATSEIREMIIKGWLPEPTQAKKRCEECEYANFCGDVW